MRNLLLGLATAALMSTAAATVGEAQPATSTFNDGVYRPGVDDPVLNSVQFYVYLGHHYCWYGDGWRGPGWYWCGYRWRHGYGWGGGYGWRGLARRLWRPRRRLLPWWLSRRSRWLWWWSSRRLWRWRTPLWWRRSFRWRRW